MCPDLTELFATDNTQEVEVDEANCFDLSTLPGFDVSKASEWVGGTVEGNILTFEAETVTYSYDTGYGPVTFTLTATLNEVGPGIAIDATNFPNTLFRNYVSDNFDKDHDGYLSKQEIEGAKYIYAGSLGISSLKGIEHFTELELLYCDNNSGLKALDLKNNTKLKWLRCGNTGISTLELGHLNLTELRIDGSKIKELEISHMSNLQQLELTRTSVVIPDYSRHLELTELRIGQTGVEYLDLSALTKLNMLDCSKNKLTSLDVSMCSSFFYEFYAGGNSRTVTVDRTKRFDLSTLQGFDVSKASDWTGGTVEGTILTFESETVTYSYDTGKGNVTFTLTTTFENGSAGDADGDGAVTVADIVITVRYMLGENPEGFNLENADMNGDGNISLGDLVALINAALEADLNRAPSRFEAPSTDLAAESLEADRVEIAPCGESLLTVSLNDAKDYTAMQFDLALPNGLTAIDGSATLAEGRNNGHMTAMRTSDNGGKARVIAYSTTAAEFGNGESELASLTIKADETIAAGEYTATLTNIMMADSEGRLHRLGDATVRITVTPTGIRSALSNGLTVWVTGRKLHIVSPSRTTVQLVTTDGLSTPLELEEGENSFEMTRPGIYIVAGHKFAIK